MVNLPTRYRRATLVIACAIAALAGTAAAQNPRFQRTVGPESFSARTVVSGLENPWEVAWGPDNWLWITERTAFRVVRVNPADGAKRVLLTLDDVVQTSVQDGVLGMALHPQLLRGNGMDYVYLAYTYDGDPGTGVTRRLRVRRYSYNAGRDALESPVDLIGELPAHDDHGAGRMIVGPDGKLYVSRGDLGSNWLANACNAIRSQDLPTAADVKAKDWRSYEGKILRMNLDGSIPDDNPVIAGVTSHIFAYGFRNPQGLAFGPGGLFYASEHGPATDDEIDLVQAGKNYGWPLVAGFNDDRSYVYANWSASAPAPCPTLNFDNLNVPASVPVQKESAWQHPDFVPPLTTLFTAPAGYDLASLGSTTIAPAGIEAYTAAAIPGWSRSILVTGMRTGAVYRLKLSDDGTSVNGGAIEYFKGNDRYRDLALSPDGRRIYAITDSFGAVLDAVGRRAETLAHPGALLEFTYTGK